MDNPETQQYTLEKTEIAIMDGQSRDTAINVRENRRGNYGWTIQRHSNKRERKQKGQSWMDNPETQQ